MANGTNSTTSLEHEAHRHTNGAARRGAAGATVSAAGAGIVSFERETKILLESLIAAVRCRLDSTRFDYRFKSSSSRRIKFSERCFYLYLRPCYRV